MFAAEMLRSLLFIDNKYKYVFIYFICLAVEIAGSQINTLEEVLFPFTATETWLENYL